MLKGEKNKDTIQHVHEKREGEIKYKKKKKIGVGLGGGGGCPLILLLGRKKKKEKLRHRMISNTHGGVAGGVGAEYRSINRYRFYCSIACVVLCSSTATIRRRRSKK